MSDDVLMGNTLASGNLSPPTFNGGANTGFILKVPTQQFLGKLIRPAPHAHRELL
ncbi:MAG TPA: hypothetical protein VGD64_04100 [Acidisarcina sp.]